MEKLNSADGDNTKINVVSYTDSICAPCPNRHEKTCTSEEKIAVLDAAHAAALKLKPDDSLTWGEAKQRMAENITLETFHQICSTCHWKSLGICENVITATLSNPR